MLSGKVIGGIIASGLTVFLFSCIRYNEGGNNNNYYPNPVHKGNIKGHIILYDQYGSRVYKNLSGFEISLLGLSTKMTLTDSNGYYIFTSVPVNTYYNISVLGTTDSASYGGTIMQNINFIADTLTRDISLSAIPSFSPNTITATLDTITKTDSVIMTFSADTLARSCIVFVNSISAVGPSFNDNLLNYIVNIPANVTSVSLSIPASDLHNVGINSGASAYFAAYGYVVHDYSLYQDYGTGKNIYTAISAAAATCSIKAP